MKVIRNAAKCLKCGDIIEFLYRHDFVWCSCENIAVDGGKDYTKFSFASDEWENLREYEDTGEKS